MMELTQNRPRYNSHAARKSGATDRRRRPLKLSRIGIWYPEAVLHGLGGGGTSPALGGLAGLGSPAGLEGEAAMGARIHVVPAR
jgi:hypothetical protein